jgi:CheY-like chemotaxis protein
VHKTLERYGYRVLEAGSCAEAIEVVATTERAIDLLFTDVILPDGTGTALASRLRPEHPEMEVLFTSGYAGDALADRGTLDLETHFLQKPYSVAVLAARVRDLLDGKGGAQGGGGWGDTDGLP